MNNTNNHTKINKKSTSNTKNKKIDGNIKYNNTNETTTNIKKKKNYKVKMEK